MVYYTDPHYANRPPNDNEELAAVPSTEEMADDQDAGAAGKTLKIEKGEKQMASKKWWASGTFWGALGGAIAAIVNGAAAFKAGDTAKVGESIMATIGFWTAWRLRKSQGVAIAAPVE